MADMVNHPNHYVTGEIEVIDYIRDKLQPEQFVGYCLGNVMKYVSRYDKKGEPVEDLSKADVYLRWAIERQADIEGIPSYIPTDIPQVQSDNDVSKDVYVDDGTPIDIQKAVEILKSITIPSYAEEAMTLAIKALLEIGDLRDSIPVQPIDCTVYPGTGECGYPIQFCSECPKHKDARRG